VCADENRGEHAAQQGTTAPVEKEVSQWH
jgi:hypothetical protein